MTVTESPSYIRSEAGILPRMDVPTTDKSDCQSGCSKCGCPGGTLVFRSRIVSLRACWRCLSRLVADARAAGVDYSVE